MAERISRALLPDNTSVADDGMAMFGGVRVDDLVAQFGTPLLCMTKTISVEDVKKL